MDIYFCDLCGVRVNDADLRTGQGQRSRWDVICASCLEQGLGKEWLGKRTSARRAAIGAGDAGDRVATIDADPPARAVVAAAAPEPKLAFTPEPPPAKSVQAPPPSARKTEVADLPPAPPGLALDDESGHEEPAAPVETPPVDTLEAHDAAHSEEQVEDTARVLKQDSADQFSMAASAFSALGSRRGTDPDNDDDDLVDRAYATPAEQLSPALGVAALTEGQSPFAKGYSPEKDETALVPALPGTDAPVELDEASNGERKPGTSTSSRRKSASAKGTSSRITKPPSKNGKSNRSRSKGPDNSRTVLMYSLISLGVIMLLFGIAVGMKSGKGGSTGTGTTVVDDKAISRILSDADAKAVAALRSQDLAEMEAALATLKSAQQSVYKFEDDMRKDGNSDAQIEGVLRNLNASDKFMHIRTLNDAIFKLKQQR